MEITLLDVFKEIQNLRCEMNLCFTEQEKRLDEKLDAKLAEQEKRLEAKIDEKIDKQTAEIAEEIREVVKYFEKRGRKLEARVRKLELAKSNL